MVDMINAHVESSGHHPQTYTDHITLFCVDGGLDQTTIYKYELEKVKNDAKNSAC